MKKNMLTKMQSFELYKWAESNKVMLKENNDEFSAKKASEELLFEVTNRNIQGCRKNFGISQREKKIPVSRDDIKACLDLVENQGDHITKMQKQIQALADRITKLERTV